MDFLKKLFGIQDQEEDRDTEYDEIVREAKRQVEFNRKIGSIVLAFIILIIGLYVHFFWDKPDKDSITVRLTVDYTELADDETVQLPEGVSDKGYFVNNNTFVIKENGTVKDLLDRFSEKRDIETYVSGGKILSIGGIGNSNYANYHWTYSVNDTEIITDPETCLLENTDGVVLRFTKN